MDVGSNPAASTDLGVPDPAEDGVGCESVRGLGRHRGAEQSYMHETGLGHCCFAGCDMIACRVCGGQKCARVGFAHRCYRPRHRKDDA